MSIAAKTIPGIQLHKPHLAALFRSARPRFAPGAPAHGGAMPAYPVGMATEETHRTIAPLVGPEDERVFTDSGIEIERAYDADDVAPGLEERLGEPGAPPFTR